MEMMFHFDKITRFWRDFRSFRSTMKEWLGEGGRPVSPQIAGFRAAQCRQCVFNQHGGYVDFAAGTLKRHLEAKMKARLSVLKEEELHTCQICSCYLPLKIHVPHVYIRQNQQESVRQAIMKDMPSCWQLFHDR
jgi:hypothetical protein